MTNGEKGDEWMRKSMQWSIHWCPYECHSSFVNQNNIGGNSSICHFKIKIKFKKKWKRGKKVKFPYVWMGLFFCTKSDKTQFAKKMIFWSLQFGNKKKVVICSDVRFWGFSKQKKNSKKSCKTQKFIFFADVCSIRMRSLLTKTRI